MIEVLLTLILLCLVGIGWIMLKASKNLPKLMVNLNRIAGVIDSLDRKSAIGKMTTAQAQKEYIRISSILQEWMEMFSKMLRNEIMEGLNGK